MDQLEERLNAIEEKIDAVYESSEKMRKYFLWTLIISVAVVVLPLIGLAFVLPTFIQGMGGGLI